MSELKNAMIATEKKTQYDQQAKKVLGQKIILAHILVHTVEEFKGMNPKEVVDYIEGTPYIGKVPLEAGLTNITRENAGEKIVGLNTEAGEVNEGLIRFDIIFYVRTKNGLSQIIINCESQKDEPTDYDILNRAVFYVSRLVSSQKERDFVKSNYDDIKPVYSIWICMNFKECTLNHYHLVNDRLLGDYEWKGFKDLLNIVMIGLTNEPPEQDEAHELHRLLSTLLSIELTAKEKLGILENEYDIPTDNRKIGEEVKVMCNLSQGVEEYGIQKGIEQGIEQGNVKFIRKKIAKGLTLEEIADILEVETYEIENTYNLILEHPEWSDMEVAKAVVEREILMK